MAASSREVVERVLRAGREQDVEAFVASMAPDGYIEWPFRPAGVPGRVRGRAEIRRHLTETAGTLITFDEHRDVVTHETTDPEVVVVEYEAVGTVVATGAPFEQTVIAVFRVRDGQVVSYRDYINPLPLMAALAGGAGER
ncbi:nuclear transport factor 2 family protein [Micromonospora sp. WMMD1128]|uniref:nuclear transport factor 2 family protein n=1 Tax=unclassified Micromonospora TaxID=2617518 RepID=UPI00248BDA7C|nr:MULTISPECIES: nuclear transport factor 2 family protein [unclassified Micromonospora]WBB76536.1 nuclear transport factor 2 family protein [Micromonospora sp. WMMD1128]WFE35681.1 nuclear transport factor 2 family protein [Micromonospora sp. WMMD975]